MGATCIGEANDGIVVGIEDVVLMHLLRFLTPLAQEEVPNCD